MTEQELHDYCAHRGIPFAMRTKTTGEGLDAKKVTRLQVMDKTQCAGAVADLLDEQGYLKAVEPESPEEAAVNDDLPEDFPGHAALTAAKITTYEGVKNAGDLTEIDGIGEATRDKIVAAIEAHEEGA